MTSPGRPIRQASVWKSRPSQPKPIVKKPGPSPPCSATNAGIFAAPAEAPTCCWPIMSNLVQVKLSPATSTACQPPAGTDRAARPNHTSPVPASAGSW